MAKLLQKVLASVSCFVYFIEEEQRANVVTVAGKAAKLVGSFANFAEDSEAHRGGKPGLLCGVPNGYCRADQGQPQPTQRLMESVEAVFADLRLLLPNSAAFVCPIQF